MKKVGLAKSRLGIADASKQNGAANGRANGIENKAVSILGNNSPGGNNLAFPGGGKVESSSGGFFKGSKVSLSSLFHGGTLSRKKVRVLISDSYTVSSTYLVLTK